MSYSSTSTSTSTSPSAPASASAPEPATESPDASTTQQQQKQQQQQQQQQQHPQSQPLPLPEPGSDDAATTTRLAVDGEAVRLDHLGPLVVHEDGTMSRIANWAEMAEIEQQNALRILGRRNKARLAALRAKQQQEQQ
jgi:hypothetical protein